MTVSEAFNEMVAACDKKSIGNVTNLLGSVGVIVPETDDGPDFTFVQSEFKVLAGLALVSNKTVKVGEDVSAAFKTGYTMMLAGKPADGVSDSAMDQELNDNLDMF